MKRFFLLFLLFPICEVKAQTVGLFYNYEGATDGYILFAPSQNDTTYLIDKCGRKVHTWKSSYIPGSSVYLLKDGTLLHTGNTSNDHFPSGGKGGIIEKIDWDGEVTWSYTISDSMECQHHDAIELPNGNILAIVWEKHPMKEAIAMGRNPSTTATEMWSDKLVEINPENDSIVWQWRAWDHTVQNFDSTKRNFGVIPDHPELIDINWGSVSDDYADWMHSNGIDYNAELDQIVLSVLNFNEVWIIDHSTTMAESASHGGGNSGRGGDLLYRWGNSNTYGRASSQKLFGQHNPTWIPKGYPGEGKILLFNNGNNRPDGVYSSVETFITPEVVDYNYPIPENEPYEPSEQDWIYTANPSYTMFSNAISGAQRLPSGNTLICVGMPGTFLEIDSVDSLVWKYVNPVSINGITIQGQMPVANTVFRCLYYTGNYPGLAGQSLVPGQPIEKQPVIYDCKSNVSDGEILIEDFSVFPNPFRNGFVIKAPLDLSGAILHLHDVTGKLLFEGRNLILKKGADHVVVFPDFRGVVILTISDESGEVIVRKKLVAQ